MGFNFALDNFFWSWTYHSHHKMKSNNFTKKINHLSQYQSKKWIKLMSFIEPKCQLHKKKWKCSHILWFQNDAWFFMKNLSYTVILKFVEISLLVCHSFTETVKLVSENWSWFVGPFPIFWTYRKIMTKKYIPDCRWRRL